MKQTNEEEEEEQQPGDKQQAAPANAPQDPSPKDTLVSMLFNILLPIAMLFKLPQLLVKAEVATQASAGKIGLVIALLFPAAYFVCNFLRTHKCSLLSILGFVGILITGLIGLLELPREYVAYERAAIPLCIAIAIAASNFSKSPLIHKLFYNPKMFCTQKIDSLIAERGMEPRFRQVLRNTSYMLAASFLVSAICNYIITAHYMADLSLDYTEALGKVKVISIVVNIVPTIVMMFAAVAYFTNKLKACTGLDNADDLYADDLKGK